MGCLNISLYIDNTPLEASTTDMSEHLQAYFGLICDVAVSWEQFYVLDGEFVDADSKVMMVKTS
jgi:hypothetical protein